jgi:hypothetical protein
MIHGPYNVKSLN